MSLAERRHQAATHKSKAAAKLRQSGIKQPTPKQIGIQATQHNTCDCWMCTTHDKEPRRQQLRDAIKLWKDEI